ncbi:MAG: hypothetical protein MJE68_05860 [Proteobacteria bacterium]|nr:hypothetical protein [Pseudomonadota bacterium]
MGAGAAVGSVAWGTRPPLAPRPPFPFNCSWRSNRSFIIRNSSFNGLVQFRQKCPGSLQLKQRLSRRSVSSARRTAAA